LAVGEVFSNVIGWLKGDAIPRVHHLKTNKAITFTLQPPIALEMASKIFDHSLKIIVF